MPIAYADGPFPLVETPAHKLAKDETGDAFTRFASEMALVHNIILRGLNAVYLHAPTVKKADEPSYLGFCGVWHDFLRMHHDHEEESLFAAMEDAAGEKAKGVMDVNIAEHHTFEAGAKEFRQYVDDCKAGKKEYDGQEMVRIIDGFGNALDKHLQDEIPTLLALREYGGEETGQKILKTFKETAQAQNKKLGLLPNGLGVMTMHDPHFEDGLWLKAFDVPAPIMFLARNLFYWFHRSWWRFSPCDRYGNLMPIEVPEKGSV